MSWEQTQWWFEGKISKQFLAIALLIFTSENRCIALTVLPECTVDVLFLLVIDGGMSPEMRCDTTVMGDELCIQHGYSLSTISAFELKERESCPPERIPMFITPLLHDYDGHTKRHRKKHNSSQEKAGRTVMLPLLRTTSSISMPAGSTKFKQSTISYTQRSFSSLSLKSKQSSLKKTELQIAKDRCSLWTSPATIDTVPEDAERLESPAASGVFRFCDLCGRSGGVRLRSCPHCKRAYYCSRVCRTKHRDECASAGKSDKGMYILVIGPEKLVKRIMLVFIRDGWITPTVEPIYMEHPHLQKCSINRSRPYMCSVVYRREGDTHTVLYSKCQKTR